MKQNLKPAVNLTALVLAAGLLIGLLTGCSQSQIGNSKPQPGNSEPQTVTITVKGDQNVIVNEPKTIEVAKGTKWSEVKLKVNVSYKDGYKAKGWKLGSESGSDLYDALSFNNNATVFAVSKKIPQPNDPDLFKTDGHGTITGYTCDEEDLPKALVIPGKIGDKVITKIGERAFRYCTGLTSIDLSGCTSLTTIGESAFRYCTGLNEVKLPASLTTIGQRAFYGCPIETLYIGCNITDSIISNLTREDSVKQHLKNLKLGEGVSTIDEDAFSGCTGLTSLTIDSANTKYKTEGNILYSKDGSTLIFAAGGLTSANIPGTVTTIGSDAFSGCSGLTSVHLPANLTKIESGAFSCCTGLTSISLPANLTKIGGRAFYGCTGLTSITLPANLTQIGWGAFSGCSGLTSVHLPANLTKIESGAFSCCTGLTSITLPANLTEIDDSAFERCTGLTSISLPANLTQIGWRAFYGCTGLASITLPANLTQIGWGAFSGCTGLTSITLPANLSQIDDSAFYGCTGLTSVTLPASLTEIGRYAFSDCAGLTSAVFADTNDWKADDTSIHPDDLANAATAAKYLREETDNGGYCNKYWKKN